MKTYNKLIRDNIPEIMDKKGVGYKTRTLTQDEYRQALLHKLVEEAEEVLAAQQDGEALVLELADVQEVLDHIVNEFGLDRTQITATQTQRREQRGGFAKKILLEYTETE